MSVWMPIAGFVPDWFSFAGKVWTGEMNGKPAWTEGHVMCIGTPPPNAIIEGTKDFSVPLQNSKRETLIEIFPVAVAELGLGKLVVIFSDGHIVDVKFYNWIHARFEPAHWFGDDASKKSAPMSIFHAGKQVALLCGMRADGFETKITEIIGSANAGSSTQSPTKKRKAIKVEP
jgi:hypothetical protein